MNSNDIDTIIKIVLEDAKLCETNAGFSGAYDDGGATRLRDAVKYYKYGCEMIVPPEWKQYLIKLDPEYEKYLELKKKFEK